MSGLDDLIGGLQKAQSGAGSGAGLDDLLGGLLGGAQGGAGGGGLGDVLGNVLGNGGGQGGGLGDVLGGLLGGGGGGSATSTTGSPAAAGGLGSVMAVLGPILASLLANGGLAKILSGMKANGLSAQADSWVGTGANETVSAEDVRRALGSEVDDVSDQLGVDADQAAQLLAGVLPGLVNSVTPEGDVPDDTDLDRLVETLQGFGGQEV
jgi:uncharacterized protein YidB (DUF937 family)